ncbi:MAG: hypothetical protein WA192_15690 [Candidatus Acidiferrales bacterium]
MTRKLYLREEQVAAIRSGIADVRAGRVVSHEKVSRWLRSWGKRRKLTRALSAARDIG